MKIGVAGVAGRMGRALVRAVVETEGTTLAAATERRGAGEAGKDAGVIAGVGESGVIVSVDPTVFGDCDAVLDFTSPGASAELSSSLAGLGTAHVIGTTGFTEADETVIHAASRHIPIVKSGNMSLGVNLLSVLVERAAAALPQADIEVLEMHHRRKVDAPSGTALLLGDAAARGRGIDLKSQSVMSREGHTGPREAGTIGFATLRGGSVIGEHDVILALDSERVVLSHIAEDRGVFAHGAVAAALWAVKQPAGLYSMRDVLGLNEG
ncbi:4-hydroxy-tetrahydrodipicolinate reductase [Acuticoccus sediminis]|uniref:4-hydroxy-tetrahydrodipicolinate reductase n=1 Tax=Acuticoccus sediminis TaxID=2184697 RepID=A0A8B2NEK3_9HYPH|nr:4-hydroxy-tetrahydrodipicolinate reductase [Acuticoccus sediminis]